MRDPGNEVGHISRGERGGGYSHIWAIIIAMCSGIGYGFSRKTENTLAEIDKGFLLAE